MSERIIGSYNDALYKSTYSLLCYMAKKRHEIRSTSITGLSCHRQTPTTHCITPIVWKVKMDAQCDKLVTDNRRQFIKLKIKVYQSSPVYHTSK